MKLFCSVVVFAGALALTPAGAVAQQAQQGEQQGHQHQGTEQKAGDTQQKGDFDLRFIDMTAMHHEMGARMAEMAEKKAENPKLKEKARLMAQDQRHEIEELDSLRARLYPDAPKREPMTGMAGHEMGARPEHGTTGEKGGTQPKGTSGMMGDMSHMQDQMDRLEKLDGPEFDQAFAKAMIEHHQMHMKMGQRAVKDAKHDEVRKLAKASVENQKKDIADLKKFAGEVK